MKRIIFGLSLLSAIGCGGGGGSGLTCTNAAPLLCPKSEGCCPRGLPYACDGLCYARPVGPCVESDFCEFNVQGASKDSEQYQSVDPKLSVPMSAFAE